MGATTRALRFAELDARTAHDVFRLRQQVFVVEQGDPYDDLDGRDTEPGTVHVLLEEDGRLVGVARVLDEGDQRARLLDLVWGSAAEIDDRTVDVHVGRLRKCLVQDGESDPVRTVRGTGYALEK